MRKQSAILYFLKSEDHFHVDLSALRREGARHEGLTLVELAIVITIIMTLAAMSLPVLTQAVDAAKVAVCIGDLRTLQTEITRHEVMKGVLPDSLEQLGLVDLEDSWGNPYEYLNFATVKGKGAMRKDKFLVPLNSTYDLYSKGKDGKSKAPLSAKDSQDDVVRAHDGSYLGLASQF